ncbi:epsilon-sarcoglycan [Anthonomus grandis grandis]|uniref:epsilon-sarcoglycan n=1 Tax=Anthonomus grandis grandis TaxID=2921223 RepID=UPI00216683DA|nr:epsilon-sarcoglycan [Anthonomus grandis grandis]
MGMILLGLLPILLIAPQCLAKDHNVLKTEVFAIAIDPLMFNWSYEGRRDQFSYKAALVDSPDLPSWINYVFSERYHSGFLYGVPHSKAVVALEVVGLNKKNYETRVEPLNIIVQDKLKLAKYEVHMKIDNLNVVDMFDVERMDSLKEIFTSYLWKNSESDLYVTFLESAVEMGARKPLNPNEGEGVIVRLGSEFPFSQELLELQVEVKPLYKISPCPRDFKRTSVERYFRDAGFALDWCSFRLPQRDLNDTLNKPEADKIESSNDQTEEKTFMYRDNIPVRTYQKALVTAIALPMMIMTLLVLGLTFILCFEQGDVIIDLTEEFASSSQEESSPQRFLDANNRTDTMGSLINDGEKDTLGRNYMESPNSTMTRGVHCRPSPPPYVRPKYKPNI